MKTYIINIELPLIQGYPQIKCLIKIHHPPNVTNTLAE